MKLIFEDLSGGRGGGFVLGFGAVWKGERKVSVLFLRWEIGIKLV